jgi:radical SAM/SPASM domain protein of ACGX system
MQRKPTKPTFAFQWHITDECDQRCKHCYIFSEGACTHLESMPYDRMMQVLDECCAMADKHGFEPYFYVTGGDPLLHPEFWRLAEELSRRDVLWAVMGNPFHVTPAVAEKLAALGCRKYQVSLDGLEATHDYFRKPGSFAATWDAIDILNDAGIWTAVMTTVSSRNMDEIPDLIDLVAGRVDVYAFSRYCPTSGQAAEEYYMAPEAYREFLLACQARIDAHEAAGCKTTFQRKDHLWTLLEYEQGRFKIPEAAEEGMVYDGCHCGIGHLTITPDGTMYGCRRMDSVVGNAFEKTPEQVFFGPEVEALRQFDSFEKCSKCELLGWCRGCPAVARGTTGSMYDPDPQCWKQVG